MALRQSERHMSVSAKPAGAVQPSTYSALRNTKTVIIATEDSACYDVFGDGTVIIKSAPGHTPGHQVLYVKS